MPRTLAHRSKLLKLLKKSNKDAIFPDLSSEIGLTMLLENLAFTTLFGFIIFSFSDENFGLKSPSFRTDKHGGITRLFDCSSTNIFPLHLKDIALFVALMLLWLLLMIDRIQEAFNSINKCSDGQRLFNLTGAGLVAK